MKTLKKWATENIHPGGIFWALVFCAGVYTIHLKWGGWATLALWLGFAFSYVLGIWEEKATNA